VLVVTLRKTERVVNHQKKERKNDHCSVKEEARGVRQPFWRMKCEDRGGD